MKFDGETRLGSALLVALVAAACVFVLMLMAADTVSAQGVDASGPSMAAADGSGGSADSSWERADSVLEVPPVYRSDSGDQPDGCAEDCPNAGDPTQAPIAVTGTADNPTAQSAAVNGVPPQDASASNASASNDAGAPQNTANGIDSQAPADDNPSVADASRDGLDSAVGTPRDYQEQQTIAEQIGNAGMVPVAPVFIPVPVNPYYLPGLPPTVAASAPALPRSITRPSVLMPPPMPRIAPLPSIVPRGLSQSPGSFPGSAAAGIGGGVAPGFTPMMGFHGAFGGFHGGLGHR